MSDRYTTAEKVRRFLRLSASFSASTNPTQEQVEDLIDRKMDEIDSELQTSYHLSQAQEYHDLSNVYETQTGVPVYLGRKNIITPLSASDGDSLKVWNGSSWEEYLGSKTENRANDFWLDQRLGILHLKTGWVFSKRLTVDITYRYNEGARTQVSGAINSSVTGTVEVDDTSRFPFQGTFTASGEIIRYDSKTSTSFNVVERGTYNTTADAHADNDSLYWVPKDVEDVCTKMVAIDLLTNEDWAVGGTITGELPGGQPPISEKIRIWQRDIDKFFDRHKPFAVTLR